MPKKKFDHRHDLVLLPLGGTGEIGMNCYCYGLGRAQNRQWLMVDLGVKFGEESEPGIDVILPDVSYIASNRESLVGLVLTHAHEDHMGAVAWLWPQLQCPVYCTAFSAHILNLKLKEAGIDEEVPVHIVRQSGRFEVGHFDLEFVSVTHSIPEPTALIIRTGKATVVHTGDWKIDRAPVMGGGFDEKRLRAIGEEGVDALICDSTNALQEGHSASEADVAKTLLEIVRGARGRVAVTTFASHVDRILSAVKAARTVGREVVIAGRAMRNTVEAARACGYLRDAGEFLDEEEFGYLPPDKIMLLCTGSQGEPRAAIARIAEDQHPNISLDPNDLVIFSSKTIPGNETAVSRVQNNLARLDVEVITSDDARVHASGHPRREELQALYRLLKPRALIPMHGEPRHLRSHAEFARHCDIEEILIPQDGQIVRLHPGPLQDVDEVHAGRLHVDGRLIVPAEDGPAKQRRKLSFAGAVFASLMIDSKQQLVGEVKLLAEGLPPGIETGLHRAASEAFNSIPKPRRGGDEEVIETLRLAIRRAAEQIWGKKPVTKVNILRLERS